MNARIRPTIRRRALHASVAVLLLVATEHVAGEGTSKVFQLDPKPDPRVPRAKIAAVEGATGTQGERFELQNLTIRQPVLVAVRATDPLRKLHLQLSKYTWETAERSGSTDAAGLVSFLVKTEGDIRILVTAESAESRYSLFAVVGDEVAQPLPSILVPWSTDGKGEQRHTSASLGLAGLGSAICLIVLAIVIRRRIARGRLTRTLCFVLAGVVGTPVCAGSDPLVIRFADWMGKFVASGDFQKIYDSGARAADAWKGVRPLTKGDARKQQNYDAGAPRVPSHCADAAPLATVDAHPRAIDLGPQGCRNCYGQAIAHLNRVRDNLERLRAAGEENKEFVEAQIAFGDSVASIPNTGAGWYSAKKRILEAEKDFEQAYDKKYAELLISLERSLREISKCEDAFFNEKNWYERFGFVYYAFVAERYKRR
jgi:hypothetical protein